MKLFFTDQQKQLPQHLDRLKKKPVQTYLKSSLDENLSEIVIPSQKTLTELDLDFFYNYSIFPEFILTSKTQWQLEKRQMLVGDTIVQQVFLPPIKALSQKLLFGVRINEVYDSEQVKRYSYETLEGHVEKGQSTFSIQQLEKSLKFSIHTFSSPSNSFTKMLGPLFAKPYQAFCTRAALRNVERQIQLDNAGLPRP